MLFKKMKSLKVIIILLVLIPLVFPTSSVLAHSYNRNKAAKYAKQYAETKNPPKWYASPRYNEDCANFASQALYYGGWKMNWSHYPRWRTDNGWWHTFYSFPRASYSWTSATYLATFSHEKGRATKINLSSFAKAKQLMKKKRMQKGDIVQYGKGNNKRHTMIVTSVDARNCKDDVDFKEQLKNIYGKSHSKYHNDGPICLSYHTSDKANRSLRAMMLIHKDQDFYLQKVKNTYNK